MGAIFLNEIGTVASYVTSNIGPGSLGNEARDNRGSISRATDAAGGWISDMINEYGGGWGDWWNNEEHYPNTPRPRGGGSQLDFKDDELGFVIGIEGSFREAVNMNSSKIEAAPDMKMGTMQMVGVAFGTSCRTAGRHGLEAVLYHYYWRRVSRKGGSDYLKISIGDTVFKKCWVIGVDFAPQDANYNIWRWALQLAVSPEYLAVPLSGPPGNTGAQGPISNAIGSAAQIAASASAAVATGGASLLL